MTQGGKSSIHDQVSASDSPFKKAGMQIRVREETIESGWRRRTIFVYLTRIGIQGQISHHDGLIELNR
ncbi:hypothetical protein BX600DRAFT_148524 [Xylariales sp. PMI_506]|nr:hypothetical protein BX600DRAFT_148524 [Xylariales sp. PMI_506]